MPISLMLVEVELVLTIVLREEQIGSEKQHRGCALIAYCSWKL